MKKTDDQLPKQDKFFIALKQYISLRHLNIPPQVQLDLKVSNIYHFPSLVHSVSTLDFTVVLFLLYAQQLSFPLKFTIPFSTVFTIQNHVVLDASLEDIQVQFKLQPLTKQYVCCIKLSYFFPNPLCLIGGKNNEK